MPARRQLTTKSDKEVRAKVVDIASVGSLLRLPNHPRLRVDVHRGRVWLRGNVPTARQRRLTVRRVMRLPSVCSVSDEIVDDEQLAASLRALLGGLTDRPPEPRVCVVLGNVYLDWPGTDNQLDREIRERLSQVPGVRAVLRQQWVRREAG